MPRRKKWSEQRDLFEPARLLEEWEEQVNDECRRGLQQAREARETEWKEMERVGDRKAALRKARAEFDAITAPSENRLN